MLRLIEKKFCFYLVFLSILLGTICFNGSAQGYTPRKLFNIDVSASFCVPTSVEALQHLVQTAACEGKKISIVGAGKSQGGQTMCSSPASYRVSLQCLNELLSFDFVKKQVTVQAGMTWNQLQKFIAPYGLAVKTMQSYSDFSIGGSLGVNVHGQDFRFAPLIQTVESFKIILASGQMVTVSRHENQELFGLAIGGYGLFGIITQVTLNLTDDILMARRTVSMDTGDLANYVLSQVKNNPNIEFFSARFSLGSGMDLFKKALVVTYEKTSVSNPKLLAFKPVSFGGKVLDATLSNAFTAMTKWQAIKALRFYFEKLYFSQPKLISRNNFMSFALKGLPQDTPQERYILQEYFIPYNRLNQFIDKLRAIINKYNVNILNMTARHIQQDTESMLSFASQEACALVLYVCMPNKDWSYQATIGWTHELIDAALANNGTFYLPYHTIATQRQLKTAYPNFKKFVALKKHYDPQEMFSNMLYECYACRRKMVQKRQ